ncbi:MAG: hypothetical protein A3J50_00895 [Candidatus Woykebacteria bacterium RIFCSPHIGHO2_02_FULL_43_16b]|uniref:RNA polymerase sigma-70 region 2 domain-containing protein n=1 Tax=Candidatus Woykebacteria bacterium RIFCSPHIGHO2_02_FULL_43_16b TaxID=1802601 RepID=A0A1G1WLR6_9BACT|nr:MAG: hypothetical protein A3J50_00895 [Candidatus Woykebacteria bacterium RIFCSPHIGHO2_02_FULL_43_16b]
MIVWPATTEDSPLFGRPAVSFASDEVGERSIISQAILGNHEAITAIIRAYQRPIYNFCFRILGSHQDAEDVTQDTFTRVCMSLSGFDNHNFGGWIYRIALHLCFDELRRSRGGRLKIALTRSHQIACDVADRINFEPGPEATFLEREGLERIRTLLDFLPLRNRLALKLFYFYNLTYTEIAQVLDIDVERVRRLLLWSRKQFRKVYERHEENLRYYM